MELSTSGVTSKIMSVGNKLAPIAGIYSGFMGDPMGDGRGFAGAPDFIYRRLLIEPKSIGQGHIGNPLITTQLAMQMPDKYPIMAGAVTGIGGWIAEEVGGSFGGKMGSLITGFGRIMKNYGTAQAISSVVAAWLYLTPYNPGEGAGFSAHGTGSTTITTSPQMSFNVGGPNAPHASSTNGYRTQLGNFESVVA